MSEIKIKKVKIVKGSTLELQYSKTESDKSITKVGEEHNAEIHKDLKDAFQSLDIHLAMLLEFIPSADINDLQNVNADAVSSFHATSYAIGGDEDDEGIVLTGTRRLKSGKTHTLNTPFTRFNEGPETAYKFMQDLQDKISAVESEVLKYLNEGKKAPDPQGSLFDSENPSEDRVSHMQIAEPLSDEEKGLANLHSTSVDGSGKDIRIPSRANPEAMARVADMDGEDRAGEPVGELVEGDRGKLRGNGRKGGRKSQGA